MKLCKPEQVVFFGSGIELVDYYKIVKSRKIDAYIFLAPRHAEEIFYGKKLIDHFIENEILYFIENDINCSADLHSILKNKVSIGLGFGEVYTFSQDIINKFNQQLFDFMVIRIPKFFGGAHFSWQILQKNRIGSWNIQIINKDMVPSKINSGEIIKTRTFIIDSDARKPEDFFRIYARECKIFFIDFFDDVENNMIFNLLPPQFDHSTYFPRLSTGAQGYINWSWSLEEIELFICAFDEPYIGAMTFVGERKIHCKKVQIDRGEGSFHPFMNGIVYRVDNNTIFIAHRDGTLILECITDENGDSISIHVGQRLYTPFKYLENAMMFVAEYDSKGLINVRESNE